MPYMTINEMGGMDLDDSTELGKFGFKKVLRGFGKILKLTPIGLVATQAKKMMIDAPKKKKKAAAGRAEAQANADAQAQADAINAQAAAVNASMAPSSSDGGSSPPPSEPMFDQPMMMDTPQGSMDQQMMTPEQTQEMAMQQSVATAQATSAPPIQYEMPPPMVREAPAGGPMTEQDWGYSPQEMPVFESPTSGGGRRRSGQAQQDPFAAYMANRQGMEGFLTIDEKTKNLTVGHKGKLIRKPSRPDMTSTWNGKKNWMQTLKNPAGAKDEWISPAFQNFWGNKRTMSVNPRPYLAPKDKSALPSSLSGMGHHHGGGHHGGGYMFPSYPLYPYYDYPYPPASLDYKPTDDVNYDSLTEEERQKKGLSGLGRGFRRKKKHHGGGAPAPAAVVVVPNPLLFPMGPPPPMPAGYDPKADDEVPPIDLMTQEEFVRAVKSGHTRNGLSGVGRFFRRRRRSAYVPVAAVPPPASSMFAPKGWGVLRGMEVVDEKKA